jgi:ATP-dependent Lon protease
LDEVVYGHRGAKERIIELIGANIRNPTGRGYCIGIQGPAGNGKTTLIKHGIAPRLGRPFTMISLGGATDSDFLAGHGYTYEGSRPGRMSEALIEAGCMNPIIFFDELDKVSQTAKGEEIYGYLCHLIDFTQNDQIHDKYFAGIGLDFSRAIFVFSFNDEKLINPILRDRIHIIRTDGFGESDKVRIARDYLLPAVLKDFNLPRDTIEIDDALYRHLINRYTNGEDGVRSLQRSIHSFISRVNINLLLGKLQAPVIPTMDMLEEYMAQSLADTKRDKLPDMYI